MAFALITEGPADACGGAKCRQLIAASGMITADTPRQFLAFMRDNPAQRATVVLESDGGSVLGALELGRAIRRLGLSTTVGRVVERRTKGGAEYGDINPRVDCQSMCTFVLLGGVKRVGAARCPGAGAPDLARRPARGRGGGELHRRGSRGGAARYRQHRAIHHGNGRRHRARAALAQGSAVGADARAHPRRAAAHPSRPRRPDVTEKPLVTKTAAGPAIAEGRRPARQPSAAGRSATRRASRCCRACIRSPFEGERIGTFELESRLRRRARQLRADLQGNPLRSGATATCRAASPASS